MADVRQLEQRIATVEARIKATVAQADTRLVQLFGVGPVLAARFLGEAGDIGRFPTRHHLAVHIGTAPRGAATRRIKADASTAPIPVIALTAHAMAGDREQAIGAGCDDYDTKPIELPRLLEKIAAQLARVGKAAPSA